MLRRRAKANTPNPIVFLKEKVKVFSGKDGWMLAQEILLVNRFVGNFPVGGDPLGWEEA